MNTIKRYRFSLSVFALFFPALLGCTDLNEKILDEQLGEDMVYNENNIESLFAPPYASLRNLCTWNRYWGLQQLCTDETAIPTRGSDWYDNGAYQQLYYHTWTADHPYFNTVWGDLTTGISRANTAIYYIGRFNQTGTTELYIREVRFLRALYMYYIADLFGQVPFRESEDQDFSVPSKVFSRAEAIKFIIDEINDILPHLKSRAEVTSERVTKGAAYALLSRIYLNHEVYTGNSKWAEAVDYCNKVIELGEHTVTDDYWTMFQWDVKNPSQFILTVPCSDQVDLGSGNLWIRHTLHYNQIFGNFTTFSNGYCTTPTFLNTWDTVNDIRYYDNRIQSSVVPVNQGFLIGQQYGTNGEPLTDRSGNPLVFTPEFSITNSDETAGVRVVKFGPYAYPLYVSRAPNDFPLSRIADIYLTRAEANHRNGETGKALEDINYIRKRRNAKGKTLPALTTVTLEDILKERGFELYYEGFRRQDLIRFGKFNWFDGISADQTKIVFPIPTSALDANENLTQNQGYNTK